MKTIFNTNYGEIQVEGKAFRGDLVVLSQKRIMDEKDFIEAYYNEFCTFENGENNDALSNYNHDLVLSKLSLLAKNILYAIKNNPDLSKIERVKIVRYSTNWGLVECKDFVESLV